MITITLNKSTPANITSVSTYIFSVGSNPVSFIPGIGF
jgi:hypothetical protein